MRAPRRLPLLLLLAAVAAPAAEDEEEGPFVRVAVVDHAPIDEMSGIVRSRTYPGVWWVHNDSGDEPRLFAVDGEGKPVVPEFMQEDHHVGPAVEGKPSFPGLRLLLAANVDWEDVALADGMLYVAETGNNFNDRRDLGVYVVPEPNPRRTARMRPLRFLPIRYPDQEAYPPGRWHFDCEALFVSGGKLYFLTKHRRAAHGKFERGTKLYRLDTSHTDRQNVLTLVDRHPDLALPTAADLSPDGERLAVLTALSLRVFEKPESGDRWLSCASRGIALLPRERLKQAEAVCWDDDETLRVANEQRDVFRIPLSALGPLPPEPAEAGEEDR